MYISAGHHSPLFYRYRVTPELEEHLIFFLENGKITTENGANSTETNQKEAVKRPIAQENCNTVHFTSLVAKGSAGAPTVSAVLQQQSLRKHFVRHLP